MQRWQARLQDLINQISHVQRLTESRLSGYGYKEQDLAELAHDVSEVYGACAALLDQIRSFIENPERDADLVGVELSKIEATLEDARTHLEALAQSLPRFNRFLSDLEDSG